MSEKWHPKWSYWSPLNPEKPLMISTLQQKREDSTSNSSDEDVWWPSYFVSSLARLVAKSVSTIKVICPWHCHYCPFIILICPPAQIQKFLRWATCIHTEQNRTKWIPIPILCQFGMHELLTYRLAIDNLESKKFISQSWRLDSQNSFMPKVI